MARFLPYGQHNVTEADIAAVVEVLKSPALTQGAAVDRFEEALAKQLGAKHVVVCSSGTAALHCAVAALALDPGSLGVTTPITFAASANCLVYCDVKPSFSTIERNSGLMDMDALKRVLEKSHGTTTPVKVVIPVHFAGQPCDMEKLWALKAKYGFAIIEDASHALGATYANGQLVGSSSLSEMAVFSFHPVKHIATGEGGAIATNSTKLAHALKLVRSHGIEKNPLNFKNQKAATSENGKVVNPWYYEMQMLGYNYRLPDILAILGVSQLERLPKIVEKRRSLVAHYNERLQGSKHVVPVKQDLYGKSSYHLMVVRLTNEKLVAKKATLMNTLRERGVGTQVHYIPVTMLPYYQEQGFDTYPEASGFYHEELSLPLFETLTTSEVDFVVKTLNDVCQTLVES